MRDCFHLAFNGARIFDITFSSLSNVVLFQPMNFGAENFYYLEYIMFVLGIGMILFWTFISDKKLFTTISKHNLKLWVVIAWLLFLIPMLNIPISFTYNGNLYDFGNSLLLKFIFLGVLPSIILLELHSSAINKK